MKQRVVVRIAVALTVVAWAPALAVAVASGVAGWADCALDEGSVHPCRIGPFDIGGLLYTFGVSGWLFLMTWPLALASALFWVGYGSLTLVRVIRQR